MTIIPFRPSITGLFITFFNAAVELTFLSGCFILVALYECNRLNNGKLVSIRKHCIFVRVLALLAMFIFIFLEVAISINSQTVFRSLVKPQPCLTTHISPNITDNSPASEAVLFECMKVRNNTFFFRSGNYSYDTGLVQCNPNVLFEYQTGQWLSNEPLVGGSVKCDGRTCIMLKANGNNLLISDVFEKGKEKMKANETFLSTKLNFNPEKSLNEYATKALSLFDLSTSDELQIRRYILMGATNTTCNFIEKRKEVTNIALWMVVVVSSVWVLSFTLFVITLFLRKKVFYDMRNTLDWARKTIRNSDQAEDGDLHVQCVLQDGARCLYVVDPSADNFRYRSIDINQGNEYS